MAALTALWGCGRPATHVAIETAMTSAYRPASDVPLRWAAESAQPVILAGDMHCHVSPPDHPLEASRDPVATVDLARSEGLDFVVLTPHVAARFFEDDDERRAVLAQREHLRAALDERGKGRTLFVLGMEYTDHRYGHLGLAFADLRAVLDEVPASVARSHPARFFERFVAHGGLLVIHHPLSTPLDSPLSIARADLSWRPFTSPGPFPEEIAAANRLAQGVEAYNMVVTHLRDRYLLGDTPRSLLAMLVRADREIIAQERRLVPVGGTDSHTSYLRPTTYVAARDRSESAIRDAILAGRTCVRSPEACSFEVRTPGGAWRSVGETLPAAPVVEARALGGDVEVIVNGQSTAHGSAGEIFTVPLGTTGCSVIRARVGEGYSAPVYVGCPFAEAR